MAKRIVLSDAKSINTKGYRIDLNGMDLTRFAKNPVMLFQHDMDKVIGRWENYSITDNKLEADPVFDDGDELGANVSRKFENDFLRAASIGIIIKDMQYIDDVWVVTASELLEASIVSIPADAGAVVLYNENREVLSTESFEKLQLQFNSKNSKSKEEMTLVLSAKTLECLGISGEVTAKEVELAVAEKDAEIAKLKAEKEALVKTQHQEYLNIAEKDGKITAAEKEEYLKLAHAGGFESVKKIIDAKKKSASTTLAAQVQKTNLSAGRESWDFRKWSKEDPKGLLKLKHENPAQYEKLKETL